MRKLLFTMLFFMTVGVRNSYGQYASVNIDYATIAAMLSSYEVSNAIESSNTDDWDEMLKHYTKAEVATAGIYLSKWLDRKALENAGRFSDAQRNYYYKHIYNLVSARIMPKVLDVAKLCIKRPSQALYWGPYLMKITEDTRNLCMQFQVVVCNSKLTFQDITFFCISDKFKELFDLAKFGNVDWKAVMDKIGDFGRDISIDDIKADIENLAQLGSGIANAGGSLVVDAWGNVSQGTSSLMTGKISEIKNAYSQFKSLYSTFASADAVKTAVMSRLISTDSTGVASLLSSDSYNINAYISDYIDDAKGRYYKQRWYICTEEKGTENVLHYEPTEPSALYETHYEQSQRGIDYPLNLPSPWQYVPKSHSLSGEDLSNIYQASMSAAGMTSGNYESDGKNTYKYTYNLVNRTYVVYYLPGNALAGTKYQNYDIYACNIDVTRTWNTSEVVYEETFDSYDNDITAFKAKMNAKLDEYNDSQDEYTVNADGTSTKNVTKKYVLKSDAKQYYSESDERKMSGCSSVSYLANCDGMSKLGEGTISWKENSSHNHEDIRDDSKEYAMRTSLSPSEPTAEVDAKIAEVKQQKSELESSISSLKTRRSSLSKQINSSTDPDEKKTLQKEYKSVDSQISQLQSELETVNSNLDGLNNARTEIVNDYASESDNIQRIPSVMHQVASAYGVTWNDDGTWTNNVYSCVGHSSVIDKDIEFTVTMSTSRGESHFLGIRYHRAILVADWEVHADYSTSNIIETMDLDSGLSDTEKNEKVNARLHELQSDYPDCTIEIQYAYSSAESHEEEDAPHLLWVSDRLALARNIEYRLTKIYMSLVLVEKWMSQGDGMLSYLKHTLFGTMTSEAKTELGRTVIRRWRNAADFAVSGRTKEELLEYNRKEEEERRKEASE